MGRRDELEPRFGRLPTLGAALGILLLLFVLAVASLDSGDEPPTNAAVQAWLRAPEHRELAGALPADVQVRDCVDTGSRLPAVDPVAVYRCSIGGARTACVAVDGTRVVAAGQQLETTRGCEPLPADAGSG